MAYIKQRSSGSWQIIIKRKSLPRPICASADREYEARAWAARMEAQIDSGFIPKEFLIADFKNQKTIAKWLSEYTDEVAISQSDQPIGTDRQPTLREALQRAFPNPFGSPCS